MATTFKSIFHKTYVNIQKTGNNILLHIKTPRLLIRSVNVDDINFYQKLWVDAEVMATFAEGQPRFYSGTESEKDNKTKNNAKPDYAAWRIRDSEDSWLNIQSQSNVWHGLTIFTHDNRRIGHINLEDGELSYFVDKAEWGKGYTSEASIALINIALPYLARNYRNVVSIPTEIMATAKVDNIPSQKILQKIGFVFNSETPQKIRYGAIRYHVKLNTNMLVNRYNSEFDSKLMLDCLLIASVSTSFLIMLSVIVSSPTELTSKAYTIKTLGPSFFFNNDIISDPCENTLAPTQSNLIP